MQGLAVRARLVSAVVMAAAAGVAVGAAAGAAYARPSGAAAGAAAGSGTPLDRSLGGVSCVGQSFCMAVGPYGDQAAFTDAPASSQVWNGRAWLPPVAVPSPGLSYNLSAVSCVSSGNCLAVGGEETPGVNSLSGQLSDAWNGHAWRKLPVLAGSGPSQLNGVACPAASRCIAVGQGGPNGIMGQYAAWAQLWNGASWSRLAPASPAGSTDSAFSGISCAGPANCLAVGGYTTNSGDPAAEHALAESWNGTSWTTLPPAPLPMAGFSAVSCPTTTVCVVVGAAADRKLAIGSAVWNGSAWATLTTPSPVTSFKNQNLAGISCVSATNCIAVGSGLGGDHGSSQETGPFAERWNGGSSWQLVAVPKPRPVFFAPGGGAATPYGLAAVSCAAAASCLAVGGTGGQLGTLSSHASFAVSWNGSTWRVLRTGRVDGLMGVSCSGVSRCLMAGTYLDPADRTRSLTEFWDGKTARLPPGSGIFGVLSDVSCASMSFCMAAADGRDIARWHGSRWTISSSGPQAFGERPFRDLSCVSRDFCVATGRARARLAEFWNGRKWRATKLALPHAGATAVSIGGLSCTQPTFCLADGDWSGRFPEGGPFAEAWNGTRWRIINAPGGDLNDTLNSVSCATRTSCMVIGSAQPGGSGQPVHLVAELWDGRRWLVMHPPGSFRPEPWTWTGDAIGPSDISCPTATSCMAVGSHQRAGTEVNVALSWNGRNWRLTKVPGPGGLSSVSCAAPGQCLAVGTSGIRTLATAWNGRAWQTIKTINP